ncbi:outer-membrane lipoprotein carrier protein LolA [Marinomonas sp. 15G1-11]|uniref:Outer-membrane lipoprotein carrier protein LolA n=1 Tax=Marinomonas phaeophyticola TaxID=3004091 RepID=A0ABT4JXV0_9GAMM|nr:outer-membrane lipoprotein carrier protein LolA [Marinomonas sp. 15G1-11]MCZ2723220.1 outer-membrane lipoprotein carrier protein LolA [Marinomonas sp. 15G1-11]
MNDKCWLRQIIVTFFFMVSAVSFAADQGVAVEDGSSSVLAELLEANRNIEGEFLQVTYNESGDQVQLSEGVFMLASPNRFVWDTIKPFPQRIISDGEWLTIWDVDLEQATKKKVGRTLGQSPAALLGRPAAEVLPFYHVDFLGQQRFRLKPFSEEGLFGSLTLSFQNDIIKAMSIEDSLGQTTVIEFKEIEPHDGVSEQNFVVDLPSNIDVFIEE